MKKLSNGLIDLGGGATPRDPHSQILLTKNVPPKPISNSKFKGLIKKLDELQKLDLHDFNSVSEMMQFLDFYNNTVLETRQAEYEKQITARNEYYWKLWIAAARDQ